LNDIHRLESGLIRISTFTSVSVQWLPSIIAKFEKDYPLVRFELLHGSDIESEDWVRSGRVDCAFMSLSEETPFVTYPLHKDPMVAVVPADHPLAAEEKIAIDDLVKYDYIKLNDSSFSDVSEIAEVFNKHKVKPNVRFAEMNDYAVVAMVEKGLGVTLLPQMIVEKTSRNIAIRPLVSGEQRTLGIAVKNQNHLTASTKEFIKYTQEWVSEKYPKEEL
ncbi:MAG: LysR family transcriptional regulator substrate-binding protein, partial [[Eubacterium] sulci]|nr:LysR family transcriptional regulator substrate-binding protein [[Eubacterium] sulci]